MSETLQKMKKHKLVAVIRGAQGEEVLSIARALYKGGVHILEVTADTPQVNELIQQLKQEHGDEMIVGAGTVLDAETAKSAITAGAQFIFSPTVDQETIEMTKRNGVVSIPGALTPTEIVSAYKYGADLIKIFPAGSMGPGYMKDIHGPLPQIPLMPTGGVDLTNIREYFEKGAVAAGLGNALVNTKEEMNEATLWNITERAKTFVQAIKDV
ncbi:bifunctional 4-hydroxy-2-oxoglutarate aldolase/2-dehydro-3-deoxy-phosphogluconate aldolase [Pontibacillus salicampi]|uniref:Bifunctional 4-hydroxy-2-oxoglutarate aldolase/2-dehydro-3-deoxy-phosphogluconate aldolase n=1 Tax=Pontibacillus salicampi TaxID=1449801 RepID=A0ABV6LKI9_9BACI